MSQFEEIFFKVDLTPDEAAEAIAAALSARITRDNTGVYLGVQVEGFTGYFGGEVSVNIFAAAPGDPGYDPAGYNGYNMMWSVFQSGYPDLELQQAGAKALFVRITEKLRWPALLAHDTETAVAVWDPERGLHEFPADTDIGDDEVLQLVPRP